MAAVAPEAGIHYSPMRKVIELGRMKTVMQLATLSILRENAGR
jgi:hypothetical protein